MKWDMEWYTHNLMRVLTAESDGPRQICRATVIAPGGKASNATDRLTQWDCRRGGVRDPEEGKVAYQLHKKRTPNDSPDQTPIVHSTCLQKFQAKQP
jgi:hypothetical protein